jgi:asparagine synthase (glutamine-hydrolysing)
LDESPQAAAVAAHHGAEHNKQIMSADSGAAVETLARYFDEPFADPAAVPTLMLSKAARTRVKVVLSGDGGDEAFGGYGRYVHDLWEGEWRERVPVWLRGAALGQVARVWPKGDWLPRPLRAKTFLTNLALTPDRAYANSVAVCRLPLRRRLLAAGIVGRLNGHDPSASIAEAFADGGRSVLNSMIAADTAVLLPDDYLVKVDRASMAYGLEVRPPLLDHHLLELAAQLPPELKVHRGQTKWIFRRACGHRLPASVRQRPKHGFDVPLDEWMRGPLNFAFEERVFGAGSPVASLIDVDEVRRVFRAHQRGTAHQGPLLWSLLVLAAWSEHYL